MASPLTASDALAGAAPASPSAPEAFEGLYREHYAGLCETVYRYVRSRDTARELVQDLFLRIWNDLSAGRQTALPTAAYLHVAARNRALRAIRHRAVEVRWEERQAGEPIREGAGPEHTMAERELAEALRAAMGELPARCRLVFSLSRHEHLPNAQIAAKLGISVSTVEQQMWRALKALRAKLGPHLAVVMVGAAEFGSHVLRLTK
jgi:RNA polymerase sigma-70 factor (ECF subfamily)